MDKRRSLCFYSAVVIIFFGVAGMCRANSLSTGDNDIHPELIFIGATHEKELYVTQPNKTSTFRFALGVGCPYNFGLKLAAIETREEVEIVDGYLASVESREKEPDALWTSGFARLGAIPDYWASIGKEVGSYPAGIVGDWYPGQGESPGLADWNCVAIWRYCGRQGHGPTIPPCNPAPSGTWFTYRPCEEAHRYLCEKRL